MNTINTTFLNFTEDTEITIHKKKLVYNLLGNKSNFNYDTIMESIKFLLDMDINYSCIYNLLMHSKKHNLDLLGKKFGIITGYDKHKLTRIILNILYYYYKYTMLNDEDIPFDNNDQKRFDKINNDIITRSNGYFKLKHNSFFCFVNKKKCKHLYTYTNIRNHTTYCNFSQYTNTLIPYYVPPYNSNDYLNFQHFPIDFKPNPLLIRNTIPVNIIKVIDDSCLDTTNTDCSICYETFPKYTFYSNTTCSHIFCKSCSTHLIDTFKNKTNTPCPMCRTNIISFNTETF